MPSVRDLIDEAEKVVSTIPGYQGWSSVSPAHTAWFQRVHALSSVRWCSGSDPLPPDIDVATELSPEEFIRWFTEFESLPRPESIATSLGRS